MQLAAWISSHGEHSAGRTFCFPAAALKCACWLLPPGCSLAPRPGHSLCRERVYQTRGSGADQVFPRPFCPQDLWGEHTLLQHTAAGHQLVLVCGLPCQICPLPCAAFCLAMPSALQCPLPCNALTWFKPGALPNSVTLRAQPHQAASAAGHNKQARAGSSFMIDTHAPCFNSMHLALRAPLSKSQMVSPQQIFSRSQQISSRSPATAETGHIPVPAAGTITLYTASQSPAHHQHAA